MAFAYLRTLVTSFLSPAKETEATNAALEVAPGEDSKEEKSSDAGVSIQSDLEIPPLSLVGDVSIYKPDPAVYEYCRQRFSAADVVYIDEEQVEKSDRRSRHRCRRIKSKERDLEIDAARRAKRQTRCFA